MPAIFSGDAQQITAPVNVGAAATVPVVATNPLQPPYQTCKAKVIACVNVQLDADETVITALLVRNPASDNLEIGAFQFQAVAGQVGIASLVVAATDQVPDPRQVTYQLQVQSLTNTGDDIVMEAYIEATLISG